MSRNTLREYRDNLPRPKQKMEKVLRAIGIVPEKEPKVKKCWSWRLRYDRMTSVFATIYGRNTRLHGPKEGVVEAFTRSEARAQIKALLGISKHRRLPDSIKITRILGEA